MTAPLRAFRLSGPGAQVALERLHVLADVRGVLDEDTAVTVWLDGDLPAALPLDAVDVSELSAAAANVEATGREGDRPVLVAADLLVRPPWVESPAGFGGIELVVPRGMAFGSGEHASTQAALRLLHELWDDPPSLLDVGTGSGILALYALRRGCRTVLACDVETAAVDAARELLPSATVVLGGPAAVPRPADLVVANLTAAEHHACLPDVLAHWTQLHALLLSGLRPHEIEPLVARLPGPPVRRLTVGDFTALAVPGRQSAFRR